MYGSRSTGAIFVPTNMNAGNVFNFVLENPNTAAASACIYTTVSRITFGSGYVKFVNSDKALKFNNNPSHIFTVPIILANTNYLFEKFLSVSDYLPATFNISSILGTPNTRYFYDPMYEFVNMGSGRSIRISGILYPEFDQNFSATLTDNATTNVQIGDSLQNRSITIEYTAKRGADYEKGTLQILNQMDALVLSESTPIGDDVGLSFAVSFIAPRKINLACTATSTGTPITFSYNASRVMNTPLTF
jgi:energy-converting hydrogenase Eha subunit A